MRLNLMGPVTTQTGYGIVVTNFFLNLLKQGVDTTLWPIREQFDSLPENRFLIEDAIKKQESFDADAPSLRIYHQFSMAESIGRGTRIGMPIFELDTFTSREKVHLSSLDHIIVNSEWAKKVVEDNGVKVPVSVVPLGYDNSIFYPTTPSKRKAVVFLNIGKWSMNKGHDVLKTCFEQAFKPDDDVELWMCCHNHFLRPHEQKEWEDYYKSGPLGHKVRIIPWQATQKDLAALINQADYGVFPARGEGFNLDLLEMLACGKEVIGTDYSAHTTFSSAPTFIGITPNGIEPAYDGKWFFNQGNWACLDDRYVKTFADNMRVAYTLPKISNEDGVIWANNYSWEKSTCKLKSAVFNEKIGQK